MKPKQIYAHLTKNDEMYIKTYFEHATCSRQHPPSALSLPLSE